MGFLRWRTTGLCVAGAAALAGALAAGSLALRGSPGAPAAGAAAGVTAGLAAGLAGWFLRRAQHRAVRDLEAQLAALRGNPSPQLLQQSFQPSPRWGDLTPLLGPLQGLA